MAATAGTLQPAATKAARAALSVPTQKERAKLFRRMDSNGSGTLSLAEIDKAVLELWPAFDHKPALMRAYKAADVSGDGLIGRREFRLLLKYLVYFNDLWDKFEEIDENGDRRLSAEEFAHGGAVVGLALTAEEAAAEFAKVDADGGGFVRFEEFCSWAARTHLLGDEEEQIMRAAQQARKREAERASPVTPESVLSAPIENDAKTEVDAEPTEVVVATEEQAEPSDPHIITYR